MIGILCKNGNMFSAIVDQYVNAEWKLQEKYYEAQGCTVVKSDSMSFEKCDCDHCKTLEHEFEVLIEEVRNEI